MACKLRNPKNLILVVIIITVFWIIFWFYTNLKNSGDEIKKKFIVPTIGYEFVEKVEPGEDTFKHLNKNILKENNDNEQQINKNYDNDMEYADFNVFPKITKKMPNSRLFIKQYVTKKAQEFSPGVHIFMPKKKTNILVEHSNTPPRTESRDIVNDYYSDEKSFTDSKEPYPLVHNAGASIVNAPQEIPLSLPVYIPKHCYIFTSERLPKELHLRPSLGNGFIGTVVHGPHVYVTGMYNGKRSSCHKAALSSTASFNISSTEPAIEFTRKYSLDVSTGVYTEISTSLSHSFVQRIYAHRTLANLLVTEVEYERKSEDTKHVILKINLNKWQDNQDFTFSIGEAKYPEVSYKVGILNAPESTQSMSKSIHLIYDHIPSQLKPLASYNRCKWVFLTAYGFSQQEAEESYDQGMKLLVSRDELYTEHVKGWTELWRNGRIDVDNDDSMAASLYAAYYAILSSIPLHFNNFSGISASGLPFGNESNPSWDRIKADQELFVQPVLLMTHVELARHILFSRNFTSTGAYDNARKGGMNGLAFPYEGALQGVDLDDKKTGVTSPHVTAAVLVAIKQYLDSTNDTFFVNHSLSTLVYDAADFLHSRSSTKDDIIHVMNQLPIDESLGVIHDSLSGNAFITRALALPFHLDPKQTRFTLWKEDALKIILPKIKEDLHASYAEYLPDDRVGEADALMLNFPLMMNLSRDVILNDLNHYGKALSPNSSPMSKSLLAINWLDVGDKKRGDQYLQTLLSHFASPFKTWTTHYRKGGLIPNHLPAIGSTLQTIIYGYGGFRVREGRLEFNPTLPLNVTSVHFVGVDYLGNSLNFVISQHEISVMATNMVGPEADVLHLMQFDTNDKQILKLNVQLTVKKSRIAVVMETLAQTQS